MRNLSLRTSFWLLAAAGWCGFAYAADFQFRHHFIARDLPVTDKLVGDYGLTALVDLDRDGHLDFVLGGRPSQPSQLYWYEFKTADNWVRHWVGSNYLSDVGLAALDVDGDGWPDLVCSGVSYRNPGRPRDQAFERIVFDPSAAGAHDILIADLDGDKKPDVVMMGDERTKLNCLCWYSIPADPLQPWTRHVIGPPVHGAITPGGVADLDGDGDLDVIRADTWFENKDGQGREWVPHPNIPMGRKGPYGICVRTAVVDLDGDGRPEIVIADADITGSKVAVLKNADGKGGRWIKTELPQSFTYGSLHALAVADFNGDGKPDIVVNEQEELLPPGRENPRWVIWENLGANRFAERIILDTKLGGHELQVGDVDGDGDIDICSKPWGPRSWNGNGGQMHVDFLENLSGAAANWPGFRGPSGQGVSREKNLPLTWSRSENVAWRVPVSGLGWSSPIVWEDRVFVTSASPEGTSCHLVCVDAVHGTVLWDREVLSQAPSRKLAENSHATPTPVTDGQLVYAAFNGGRIVAADFAGKVVWSWHDSQFVSKHGLAASPLLYGDLLIMPFDGNGPADVNNIGYLTAWDGAFIAALDKHTGREKWRAKRGLSRQAHVTPMITEVNGQPQLISGAGDVVQGFDPSTGERIWTVKSPGEGVVPAMVCGQGLVFTSSGYGAPTLRAIRLGGRGDLTTTHIAWESRVNVPLMPSCVYADGLLFCLKESGFVSCLEADTGRQVWLERLGGAFGASPVLAEGRLYCLAEDGSTTVIAAGRTFQTLARNPLEGPCKASPAISRGRIFIRSQDALFCIRDRLGK